MRTMIDEANVSLCLCLQDARTFFVDSGYSVRSLMLSHLKYLQLSPFVLTQKQSNW